MRSTDTHDQTFGPNAASQNLALPAVGNITMYEQLVFLPNSVRNSDVAHRFALNGVHQQALTAIWQQGRVLATHNGLCGPRVSLRIWSHGPFHRWGYNAATGNNWTPMRAYENRRPNNWDDTNLSWAGCQLDVEHWGRNGEVETNYPFEDLAQGVRQMPTGFDALDLTRCVQYAQQNPGLYVFPRDFAALTQRLGGPQPVMYGHTDAAVARRWDTVSGTFRSRLAGGLIPQQDHDPVPAPAAPVAPMVPVAPAAVPVAPATPNAPAAPVAPTAPVGPTASGSAVVPVAPIVEEWDDHMEIDEDLWNVGSPQPFIPPSAPSAPTMDMPTMPLMNPLDHMPLLSPVAQPAIWLNDESPSPVPWSPLQGELQDNDIQQQVSNAGSVHIEQEHENTGPSEEMGPSSGVENSYNGETEEEFLKAICHVWDDDFDDKF